MYLAVLCFKVLLWRLREAVGEFLVTTGGHPDILITSLSEL